MAIYKFNEYFAEFPNRKEAKATLNRFADAPKSLHEMSIDEINAVTAKWEQLAPTTAKKMRMQIKLYFEWVAQNGIKTNLEAYKLMDIPVKQNQYLVYSTDDLRRFWDKAFNAYERYAAKTGKTFDRNAYLVSEAASILSFYGLTEEEIIDLDLCDVTAGGVKGLSDVKPEDIEVLMAYRNVKVLSNNLVLNGVKYIRNGRDSVTKDYLTNNLHRKEDMLPEDRGVKTFISCAYAYKMGKFARAYEYEIANKVTLGADRIIPKWFTDIMGKLSPNATTKYKNEFIEYRAERRKAEIDSQPQPKPVLASRPAGAAAFAVGDTVLLRQKVETALIQVEETEMKLREILELLNL